MISPSSLLHGAQIKGTFRSQVSSAPPAGYCTFSNPNSPFTSCFLNISSYILCAPRLQTLLFSISGVQSSIQSP